MKKIVLSLLACAMFAVAANAQTAIEGKKFFDNWSVGLNVGGATPLHNGSFHPVIGIGVDKKLNTVVGFGLEFTSAF
ncbi:MAG: OmpA family protein, partial [Prevotellaceae bacterium]|nr:OmpA family protein [Prevotellaceae bacterium]